MGDELFQDEIVITSGNEVILKEKLPFRLIIPTFEIFSSPTFQINDIKQRRFNVIDRAVQQAKEQIMSEEDSSIFEALDKLGDYFDITYKE